MAPEPRYWPRWSSLGLLGAGPFICLVETTSVLVLVGAAFAGLGAYGLLRRGRNRIATTVSTDSRGEPDRSSVPSSSR